MPYYLREQPRPIEDVILHLGVDLRGTRLLQFETQTHLSKLAGVSQSTWSMVENGLAEGIRLETLARMAMAVRCDLGFIACRHPPEAGRYPANGRTIRTRGATGIPGTRRLRPGPDWQPREPW